MTAKQSIERSYVPGDKVIVSSPWKLKEGAELYYEVKITSESEHFWGYKLLLELPSEDIKRRKAVLTILNDNLPASSVLMMLEGREGSPDLTKTAILQLFTKKVEFVIQNEKQDLAVEIVFSSQFGGISRFSRKISPNVWSKFFKYAIEEE